MFIFSTHIFILAYLTPKNVDPRRRFANGSSERPDLVEITRT
ncbi:unnamed protein product, partial [Rotaria magnacalcarata]